MKDMYSFHENQEDFQRFYEVVKGAYKKIYSKLGLVAKVTEASGGSFSKKISYEFMVLTDAGEDDILYCSSCDYCINVEIAEAKIGDMCTKCGTKGLQQARASEVGNVFDLGQKYPKDFDLGFLNKKGEKEYPVMGCYGIGISRIMGVVVEKCSDERGIIWPESIAPFKVHLVGLDMSDETVYKKAQHVYKLLQSEGLEVLFDDRTDVSPGAKFADADLIGIPYRMVVSKRSEEDKFEVKKRSERDTSFKTLEQLISLVK